MATLEKLSVKPSDVVNKNSPCMLLIGPIGAGKSHFIETLAGSRSLNISKDQLDGFTQEVGAYEVLNLGTRLLNPANGIYLIDTPGFSSDDRMGMDVFKQVKQFMINKGLNFINYILYFQPITDVRLGSEKRTTIQMLHSLLQRSRFDMRGFAVVTTMWDTIWTSESEQSAYVRFDSYKDDVFQEFVHAGARVSRYGGTQESALKILDDKVEWGLYGALTVRDLAENSLSTSYLLQDLAKKLEMRRSKQHDYREQKRQFYANPNKRLESIVLPGLQKAEEDAERIRNQLLALRLSPGAYYDFDRITVQHMEDKRTYAQEDIAAIREALARCGPGTDPSSLENRLKEAQMALAQAHEALTEAREAWRSEGINRDWDDDRGLPMGRS